MNQITKLTQFASMFFMTLALSLLSLSISAQTTDTGWLTNHNILQCKRALCSLVSKIASQNNYWLSGRQVGWGGLENLLAFTW